MHLSDKTHSIISISCTLISALNDDDTVSRFPSGLMENLMRHGPVAMTMNRNVRQEYFFTVTPQLVKLGEIEARCQGLLVPTKYTNTLLLLCQL